MTVGGELKKGNEYEIRSAMTAGMSAVPPPSTDEAARQARAIVDQYRGIQKFYYGDYYPLTPYSQRATDWMAWQFDLPEHGEGMVQAFRRPETPSDSIRAKLRGLEPAAVYTLVNLDLPGTTEMTGRELMESGLPVVMKNRPGAAIVTYRKKP